MSFLTDSLMAAWALLADSGAYLLFGFLAAGLIHAFVPVNKVSSWLGPGRWRSVVNASLIGTPLPLCSCSVVPVAATLRKSGASKGATTAFLISTPESGVDSIAVTYALLDPVMTVARPLAAFLTATVAGLVQNALDGSSREMQHLSPPSDPAHSHANGEIDDDTASESAHCSGDACSCSSSAPPKSYRQRLGQGMRFGLVDLFKDLAIYLIAGFLVAGIMSVVLERWDLRWALQSSYAPLAALLAGIPVYVCASSATPMVAVAVAAGMSPGAGLVFLLAGPATNAATLVLLQGVLGFRSTVVYAVGIAVCALAAGYLVDAFYAWTGVVPRALTGIAENCPTTPFELMSAVALLILMVNGLRLRYLPPRQPQAAADQA